VRAYTMQYFKDSGFTVYQCEANFMMVDIRREVKAFKLECVNKGVAVGRPFPPLNTHVRVSFGTMSEMKKALHVFRAALA
jgi:histidinol-phosphate/aromatic aminotransferase/cobyric acid decarboxylase-like protein